MTDTAKSSEITIRGRPPVTPEQRKDMQVQISQTAQHLFHTEGFSKISMRRLSSEIGCSPMTLYKYYPSKMDILRSLWGDIFKELFDNLAANDREGDLPVQRLQSYASAYVRYWLTHPDHYRLVFMADGVTQQDVSIFADNPSILARFQIFAELVSAAHDGGLDAAALKMKSESLICFLHGIAHTHITISGYGWSKAEDMVAIAVRGVGGSY